MFAMMKIANIIVLVVIAVAMVDGLGIKTIVTDAILIINNIRFIVANAVLA